MIIWEHGTLGSISIYMGEVRRMQGSVGNETRRISYAE
jgi:hypothetical protein